MLDSGAADELAAVEEAVADLVELAVAADEPVTPVVADAELAVFAAAAADEASEVAAYPPPTGAVVGELVVSAAADAPDAPVDDTEFGATAVPAADVADAVSEVAAYPPPVGAVTVVADADDALLELAPIP